MSASWTAEFRRELGALYQDLDAEIAQAGPVCQASGRCCRFQEYGHTLFLSQAEADLLLEPGMPAGSVVSEAGCPYQIGGKCTARERRPIGCRIYYCDPNFQDQQQPITERFIARLKRMHEQIGRDWRYRPLIDFLREAPPPPVLSSDSAGLVVLNELS
jgi:hypothetical protein